MPSCVRHACRYIASDLYSGVVARGSVLCNVYVIADAAVGIVAEVHSRWKGSATLRQPNQSQQHHPVCTHNAAGGDACVMRAGTHGRGDEVRGQLVAPLSFERILEPEHVGILLSSSKSQRRD
jgi:hypothetical protein